MRRGSVAPSSWPSSADARKPVLDRAVRSKRRAQSAAPARASEPRARARARTSSPAARARPQLQRAAVRDRGGARPSARSRPARQPSRCRAGSGARRAESSQSCACLHWAGRSPRPPTRRATRSARAVRGRDAGAERARVDLDARARGVALDRVETERVHLIYRIKRYLERRGGESTGVVPTRLVAQPVGHGGHADDARRGGVRVPRDQGRRRAGASQCVQERARLEGVCWPPTARDAPRRSLPHIRGRVRSPQVYDAHKVNAWTDDVTHKAVDALVRSRTRGSAPPRRPFPRDAAARPRPRLSLRRAQRNKSPNFGTWSRASCCRSRRAPQRVLGDGGRANRRGMYSAVVRGALSLASANAAASLSGAWRSLATQGVRDRVPATAFATAI